MCIFRRTINIMNVNWCSLYDVRNVRMNIYTFLLSCFIIWFSISSTVCYCWYELSKKNKIKWNGIELEWVEYDAKRCTSAAITMTNTTIQNISANSISNGKAKIKWEKWNPKKKKEKKKIWNGKHINKTCVINFKWTCQRI